MKEWSEFTPSPWMLQENPGFKEGPQPPMNEETLQVKARAQWARWLQKNAQGSTGIWLVYFKKHTGKPTITYEDAVREALCHGWIDSTVRRIDDERYMQRFAPRRKRSNWSKVNRRRAEELMAAGEMKPAGLAQVEAARANGQWEKALDPKKKAPVEVEMPAELQQELAGNREAAAALAALAPGKRRTLLGWVAVAKREDTRRRRAAEAARLLAAGQWTGLK